jgi:hypothetical protein
MQFKRPEQPVTNAMNGIQRAKGILKDQRYLAPIRQEIATRSNRRYVAALEKNLSAGWSIHTREKSSQRTFATTALADERHDLALEEIEVDVVERVQLCSTNLSTDRKMV